MMPAGDADLIRLLATGLSYEAAGAELGLSKRTVIRRMKDPGFRAAVEAAGSERVESLVELLSGAATDSVKLLRSVVMDPSETTANQVRAAGIVLAELARRVDPQRVQMSRSLDIGSLSAE